MSDMIELSTLPDEHPLRNTPLGEIGAEYRHIKGHGDWSQISPGRGLGLRIFNELGPHWTNFVRYRVPASTTDAAPGNCGQSVYATDSQESPAGESCPAAASTATSRQEGGGQDQPTTPYTPAK